MVLSLTATGIQSDAADSGTYTWADVVALSSPFLITHTQTSGRPFYRWTGLMLIQGSATLNAWLIALELLGTSAANPGIIQARGTAKVNFARKRTINGKPFYDKSCQIIVTRTRYLSPSGDIATDLLTAPLSCNLNGSSEVNIYASEILVGDRNAITDTRKRVVLVTKFFESNVFNCETISTGIPDVEVVPVNSGSVIGSSLINTTIGAGITANSVISNNNLYDSGLSAYAESSTSLEVSSFEQNLEVMTAPTVCFYLNNVNYVNSPTYNLAQQLIYKNGTGSPAEHKKLYTHDLKIASSGSPIQNVLVIYSGRTNQSFTSISTGLVSQFKLTAQETNLAGYSPQPNSYATYAKPIPLIDYSSYVREIRSYLHEGILETISVDSQVGSAALPFTIALTIDSGITQTVQATAAAVTAIAHTVSTITVSVSRSIAEIYDSRKAYQRNNGGIAGRKIGAAANFGNLNITIATTAAISPSIAKFLDGMQTAGIITLTDARAYNGVPFEIATGGSVLAAVGSTDLQSWTFATGTAINRIGATGSAIVTVAVDQLANVTAGAGVTVQVPQATIRFFGIPDVSNAIISVQDLTTSVITYPTIVAGEVTVTVNTARNYKIRADAPGYLASRFFTIPGTTPEFQFNLADYRSLYLSGVNRASQISFNPTTFVITITDLTLSLSFADVFRTIEDYLASQQGLAYTAHPFPIVLPSKNLLWFPFDTTANAVNPARIKPATTNTSDPELLFETYLEGAADTTYGLFDFTGAGGRIIRIRSEVAIAQVLGDGSFTISDRVKLEEIKTNTSGSDFVIL